MTITIGTNIASYSTRMRLNQVSDSLSDIFRKLSTGKKINSAGDDAAGLVISQNMEAKIAGSRQAMQNIQTAQSFLNIAEDGMVSIADHFQRINDLLTNMANDTNDINSRTAAIREVIERLSEIDRLAQSTNFNGMSMLDGSAKSIYVQMGESTDSKISTLEISKALTDCHVAALDAELPGNLHPEGKINSADSKTLIPRDFIEGEYWLSDEATPKVVIKQGDKFVYATPDSTGEYIEYTGDKTVVKSGYEVEDTSGPNAIVVSDGADTPKYYTVGTDAGYTVGTLEDAYNPNNENCRFYMAKIQKAISTLATQRGLLGAYENRMESSYDSLSTRIESLETAKVPYTDTDIAQEATALTQKQILEQINVAIMQSANSSQQMALSLLG